MKTENIIKLILIYWILLGSYALFFDAGFRILGGTPTDAELAVNIYGGTELVFNWGHIFNMWVLIPLVIATINKIIFKK